jgi:hypothetical protein
VLADVLAGLLHVAGVVDPDHRAALRPDRVGLEVEIESPPERLERQPELIVLRRRGGAGGQHGD